MKPIVPPADLMKESSDPFTPGISIEQKKHPDKAHTHSCKVCDGNCATKKINQKKKADETHLSS